MKVMPAPLGGVGQQVADNLYELGKSTVQSAAKAGGDLVGSTIEQLTSAPSGVSAQQADKAEDTDRVRKEQEAVVRKQKEKQQYDRVLADLEQFRQRKQQLDAQIAEEKSRQEQQKAQGEAVKKREKESFVQSLLRKVGAGSHGETDRQKE